MSESAQLVDEVYLDREMCARSLEEFVKAAWHQVEPGRPYIPNWHISAICDHLQAVSNGEINRLLINVPPSCMKSLLTCVFWPVWEWTLRPEMKWIYASYAATLSRRDALKSRRIMEGDWFQQRWGNVFTRKDDEWTAARYVNSQGGLRLSTSVGGWVTGDHADRQVVDDPLKPAEVTGSLSVSKNALDKCWTWWTETMATRLVDFEKSSRVIIMQRLHDGDLSGRVLSEGGWEHLCLPMEYESEPRSATSMGFTDPRKEADELLWPSRFSEDAVISLKRDLGTRGAASQLQQRPAPRGGAIFKRVWFKFYYTPGHERLASEGCVLLPRLQRQLMAWDCAFKGTDISDFVVGQVWGADDAQRYYLLDQFRGRVGFSDTLKSVKSLMARWPTATTKLVEDAANGAAVVDALQNKFAGFQLVSAAGGKEARANAVEPIVESGNVYFPHPEICPWVNDLIEELCVFPAGVNDDQVDAMTHALARLHLGGTERYIQAMQKLRASHGR